MLGLKLVTDPRWANLAEKSIAEILTDHAYCEQKATSTCISLIQDFPEYNELVEEVSPVVTEEWGHFRMVLAELKRRDLVLGPQRKNKYVNRLLEFKHKGGSREDHLLERLLISALIEARSCERFRILSENLKDAYMKEFYHKFMVSEAGHYVMFLELAYRYLPKEKVKKRWEEYLRFEAEMIQTLTLEADRIH